MNKETLKIAFGMWLMEYRLQAWLELSASERDALIERCFADLMTEYDEQASVSNKAPGLTICSVCKRALAEVEIDGR